MHDGKPGMRPRTRPLVLAAALAALTLLTACSAPAGGGAQTCSTTGQGSLSITVTAPGGITPLVHVTGPGSYHTDVSATTTIPNLAAGTYLVETLRVVQPPFGGTLIGTAYGATSQPVVSACVVANQTASVGRSYALQTGSQMLWAGNQIGGSVVGFTTSQLAAGGTQAGRSLDLTGSNVNTADGFQLAFGPAGDLWVSDPTGGNNGNGQLLVFDQGKLAGTGAPSPDLTVEAAAFSRPGQLAFDLAGDLYLLNRDANQVLEYTAEQVQQMLATGGSQSTAPAFTYKGTYLVAPMAMAFDDHDNLWLVVDDSAVASSNVQLVRYDSTTLGSGGALTANYRIRGVAGSSEMIGYTGLAFDVAGNLWVAGGGTRRFASGDVAPTKSGTTTSVIPTLVDSTVGGGPAAETVALDAVGRVWVSGYPSGLDRVTPPSTANHDWLTSTMLDYPMGLAIYPSPLASTLPLR